MRHISVILTTFCDWSCSYCNVISCGVHWATKDKIDRHVDYIKHMLGDYELILSGGEIGYVDSDILEYLLSRLDKKIIINTNGMFMEAGLHKVPGIRKYIKKILYHVIDEPRSTQTKVYVDDELDISYGIVGNDVDSIVEYVSTNQHIVFDYIAMDTNFDNIGVDYVMLNLKLKELTNITENARLILEGYAIKHNHIQKYRGLCRKVNFSIDISSEEICLCAFKNKHISIPLTENNLVDALSCSHIFDGVDMCDTCNRVCMDMNLGSITRDIIRNKQLHEKA